MNEEKLRKIINELSNYKRDKDYLRSYYVKIRLD